MPTALSMLPAAAPACHLAGGGSGRSGAKIPGPYNHLAPGQPPHVSMNTSKQPCLSRLKSVAGSPPATYLRAPVPACRRCKRLRRGRAMMLCRES